MIINVKSILTGLSCSKDIDVTPLQISKWQLGGLIQDVMPNISAEDRDFIKGIFWDECGWPIADVYSDELPAPPKEIIIDMFNPVAAYLRDGDNES